MQATDNRQDGLIGSRRHSGPCIEADITRSELHHTKAALTKSISETVVALDDLVANYNMFEDKIDGNLSLVHSKLDKLSRAQVQQVSTFASET